MNQLKQDMDKGDNGPRAIQRVPEVLAAIAAKRGGSSLAELSQQLKLPKTSLHRLLRTLEHGGYLAHEAGSYHLGPESFHLAKLIERAAPVEIFPACARPVIEWLAQETQESVMLGVLSEQKTEIVYIEVIDSVAPLRFTVPLGNRRPLYSAASGKAVLAFMPAETQQDYLNSTEFLQLTPDTTRKDEMPALLEEARANAVVFDRNGSFVGGSAVASPAFDRRGHIFCAVSVAGPTERIESSRSQYELLVRKAGERISRILGYKDEYPPSTKSRARPD